MVASGPTIKDSTTSRDAKNILQKYRVLEKVARPVCKLVETPKEDRYFEKVHNFLLVSAKQALEAMKNKAEDFGFETRIFSNHFQGEARVLGRQVTGAAALHQCLLGAGESTVTIVGYGKGGRNQEMALGALSVVVDNQVLLCLASDGYDNTEVAGAIVDSLTQSKAKALGLNPEIYLNNNDSFHFFEAMDDLVETGLTGSNAADFFVCLKD
jgi:glycerate-2-kinase